MFASYQKYSACDAARLACELSELLAAVCERGQEMQVEIDRGIIPNGNAEDEQGQKWICRKYDGSFDLTIRIKGKPDPSIEPVPYEEPCPNRPGFDKAAKQLRAESIHRQVRAEVLRAFEGYWKRNQPGQNFLVIPGDVARS